jgi:predicted ATP-dependent endonuclease of OLD family
MSICSYLESEEFMLKIAGLEISSFRSILNLKINIENEPNLISICGENNVGKTNTLRAINLFFNPDEYDILMDRPTLKQAQGGARIAPKIVITFYNEIKNEYYKITRDFKYYDTKNPKYLVGVTYTKRGTLINSKSKKVMLLTDIKNKLDEIEFRYIESINIDIPDLIEKLTTDAIDVEYEQSRMTKSKQELKDAYIKYTTGLQEILDVFSKDISQTFNEFKSFVLYIQRCYHFSTPFI